MYYSHNLHSLAIAESMAGRLTDSLGGARKLEDHAAPNLRAMLVVEIFMPTSTLILVRFRRRDEILKLPMPEATLATAVTYWHLARGMAFIASGQVARAEREHRDFLRAEKGITEEIVSAGRVPSETVRRVADHVLSARIAGTKAEAKTEIELLRKGVEIEDSVGYDEPPTWYLPTRESLGGALLRNGHYTEAERVFRADLERIRRNGRSLFGLMGALTSQNRPYEAALVRQEFESAWRLADTPPRFEDL